MPFEGILGMWAFGIVCVTITIIWVALKLQHDRQQKKKDTTAPKDS